MDIGPSEAETFWTAFLRKLARRGLRGVKLVISDAHEGLKAAIAKALNATWQRCRVGLLNKGRQVDASAALVRPDRGALACWAVRMVANAHSMTAVAAARRLRLMAAAIR